MSNLCRIPAIVFLFAATALLILTSVSVPFLPVFDFVRTQVKSGNVTVATTDGIVTAAGISQLKFGTWGYCVVESPSGKSEMDCSSRRLAYGVVLSDSNDPNDHKATIGPSWTRGLAVHMVAAGVSVIAFALSLSTHIGVTLLASLFSFLAFLVTLAALIIDLALLGFVRSQVNGLDHSEFATKVAPALWMTLASLGLLFLSGCIVCCGRRARGKTFKAVELKPDSVVEQGPDHETNNENFWVKCLRRRAKH